MEMIEKYALFCIKYFVMLLLGGREECELGIISLLWKLSYLCSFAERL